MYEKSWKIYLQYSEYAFFFFNVKSFILNASVLFSSVLDSRRQFLRSPNFDGWFRNRRKEMMQKLEALHLEALCEEDLQLRIQKHTEVETVDLVLKLKEKLVSTSVILCVLRQLNSCVSYVHISSATYPYAYFYANSGISHKNCKLSCKICIKKRKGGGFTTTLIVKI